MDTTTQVPPTPPNPPITPDEVIRVVGPYTIKLIRPKCISAASCVAISPDVFELDEQALVKFVEGVADPNVENILLSAQSCPTAAIIITNTQTGEQLWPPAE